MATIHKEILIDARPEEVWDAMRDVGALHTRLVPGFVVDTQVEGDVRTVTFGNGMVARERIINVDDDARRIAYGVLEGSFSHHSASGEILPAGEGRSRFVWIADLLPDDLADYVGGMMEEGAQAMKRAMEKPQTVGASA